MRVLKHLTEDAFAHAVQALQFKWSVVGRGHFHDGRNRARVVPSKLRVNGIGRIQQRFGAGQVGHIGVVFVGEDRVMRQAELLGAFDFRVPVRAFNQPTHQAQFVFAGQHNHVLHQVQRSGLVRLQRQAKAAPLGVVQGHQRGQCLKYV